MSQFIFSDNVNLFFFLLNFFHTVFLCSFILFLCINAPLYIVPFLVFFQLHLFPFFQFFFLAMYITLIFPLSSVPTFQACRVFRISFRHPYSLVIISIDSIYYQVLSVAPGSCSHPWSRLGNHKTSDNRDDCPGYPSKHIPSAPL